MFKNYTTKKFEIKVLIGILFVTLLVYLNHFNNPFFFDDVHTISENESIRSLSDWPTFFTDATTFSSLPANRAYRPMVTLMNAIDYAFAGGLNPSYFHYHIFFWFLALIVLVFILTKHIYKSSLKENKWIGITALFATAWFALHTANAETINYICARSDSFSTLCIVASLLVYIHPVGKKWHLYLIPMIIGIWTKQTGVMFFPILCVYVLLFEEHSLLTDYKTNTNSKIISLVKKVAPAGIIAISLFLINHNFLTPESTDSTNFTVSRFEYITTQFYVIRHYLGNFMLPINLSADPDIAIIKPWYSFKILSGLLIISGMIFIMVKTALSKAYRPIAFGIAWFFIALIPTTLNPLFQIANDHRMFFPFIGLFIAVPWGVLLLIDRYDVLKSSKKYGLRIAIISLLILAGHAYGTIQRGKVWDSTESLWLDVVVKSPKNGRGLMNYGLTHMSEGNYEIAAEYFNRALEYTPNYYSLYINLGILNGGMNKHEEAVYNFEKAISYNANDPSSEYYYARYLIGQKKYEEARFYLQKAIEKSPNHTKSTRLLASISDKVISPEQEIETILKQIETNPDPQLYLDLSIKYFDMKDYDNAINTCKQLLELEPDNADAYNNLCVIYNRLGRWEQGAEACKNALKIKPDFQLAKNNLRWAEANIQKK